MTHNETISDIIRKIRAEADYIEETARGSFKAGENYDGIAFTESDLESALDLAETKRKEADRLEAALKRDTAVGDCAKLRAAVTALVDYLNNKVKRTSKCNGCQYYDNGRSFRCEPCYWNIDCGIDGCDISASDNAKYLLKRFKLQAALSAPPRNCDRFATVDEALKAWDGYLEKHPELPPSCKTSGSIIPWLFSTATEKEGENNADE